MHGEIPGVLSQEMKGIVNCCMSHNVPSLVAILSQMEEDGRTYKPATINEIRAAVAAGSDVNARDANSRTPLMLAAQNRRKACIHVLIAHGADIFARDENGCYALWYMPRFFYFANPDVV